VARLLALPGMMVTLLVVVVGMVLSLSLSVLYELLPYSILHTYPELFKELQAQMPEGLAEYLDMKYNLIESK
jgi:hypothetical protein